MLKTWAGRQRNKSNQFDILAEALRLSGRADLSRDVLRWKPQNAPQQGRGVGAGIPQPLIQPVGQPQPLMQPGLLGQPQGQAGLLGQYPQPQQVYGGRPQQRKAPATQSRPPDIDVKKLKQYQPLKDMFPEKEAEIVRLLKENPNAEADSLVDKLLS